MSRVRPELVVFLLVIASSSVGPIAAGPASGAAPPGRPNIVIVSVDTLRADRLSGAGYGRATSPALDRLFSGGARFLDARTVEPLTTPSLASMLTSSHPHEHGSTRNGLPVRPGLQSLPKVLRAAGWETAAFVGNWTLRDRISGLSEHFDTYGEVLTHKRWLGMVKGEGSADELTDAALAWLGSRPARATRRPYLLWVHYADPHAPYRLHAEFAGQLGIDASGRSPASDRYDSEIAFTDREIGRLLDGIGIGPGTIVVFLGDHGESLGEHGYWGHGRNLYEETLRVPMALVWPGHVASEDVRAPALTIDLAPTVLRLCGIAVPAGFDGFDWSMVLRGGPPPLKRVTTYQAHKGAVIGDRHADLARRGGLLEVGILKQGRMEIVRVENSHRSVFDLDADRRERASLVPLKSRPSDELAGWMRSVTAGLSSLDGDEPPPVDDETARQLRSLGYVE